MAANGKAVGRAARPRDASSGEVIKADPATGRAGVRWLVPGGGGIHGMEWAQGALWITSLRLKKLSRMDPDAFEVQHQIPVELGRAHGLSYEEGAIWCVHTTDRVVLKYDAHDGTVLDKLILPENAPEPHGMTIHDGVMYIADAGIAPGAVPSGSPWSG